MNISFKAIILILTLLSTAPLLAQISNGEWQTQCLTGAIRKQNYINNKVSTLEYFYRDRNCQSLSLVFETSGFVYYPEQNPLYIDFTYAQIKISLHNSELVDDFNTRRVCGLHTWVLAQAQDITGLKCALFNVDNESPIPRAGDIRYGLYLIQDSKLYYGRNTVSLDGSTPQKRPESIRSEVEYFRQ